MPMQYSGGKNVLGEITIKNKLKKKKKTMWKTMKHFAYEGVIISIIIVWGGWHSDHLTDEEIEAERG